ncbi:SRPBCC domain-containing protein [Microlunatus aurantiacus]|uniref:SRPBCC domain-containing protein n=1 Tax=Microlunatus aurantiacus TaxID=446786 RepID=A0ABP7CT94_9ACTN
MDTTTDPIALVRATDRRVVPTEVDGLPARVVTARRSYRADIADLWDALTSVERLPRWFAPVTGDLERGGRYQVEGNAGGEIQSCEPPHRFAMTWEFMGAVSWLAVELTEVADGTLLELRHTQHTDNDFWRQFGPGATGVGWDLSLLGLGQHLAGAPDVDPAQAEAWSLSQEGKAFSTGCADGWAQADIEAGADPETAREAGAATGAFYRGESGEPGEPA